jgi:serine/tyrosine/threonine adenylyltransferase
LQWFCAVCERSIDLVVAWQRVGFVHGVLNTDNMAVNGLTIDYGPYGWIDDYDPNWTPNTTDSGQRRYRFGAQPEIVRWNLFRLANAIYPLIGEAGPLQDAVDGIAASMEQRLHGMTADKLGVHVDDFMASPVKDLLEQALVAQETDMTLFFRSLSEFCRPGHDRPLHECVQSAFYAGELLPSNSALYQQLDRGYRSLIRDPADESRRERMRGCNPRYVLRNYLAQQAIDAAHLGDWSVFHELAAVLRQPYAEQPEQAERFGAQRPDWARSRAGCSMLSCSS